jgi:Circularly permutated YpsA SLOG family
MYPARIICGGQRGADQAGLWAAIDLGIPTGGTAPAGYRVCCEMLGDDLSDPWLAEYGLIEHGSRDYRDRTIQNVRDSDATVWIGSPGSPGGKLTLSSCSRTGKPYIVNPTPYGLRHFCNQGAIKTLNVAGNRDRPGSEICDVTYRLIGEAFGSQKVWCVSHVADRYRRPYAGPECDAAGVKCGAMFATIEVAKEAAERLCFHSEALFNVVQKWGPRLDIGVVI